jgi:HemY protein
LLEGDNDAARSRFEAMLDDPETRILGLRGLYLEARRLSDPAASRHYARRAAEIAPQLEWATNASLEFEAGEGNWDNALNLVETQRSTRQIDKDEASRRRAVLLTAKAMEEFDSDQSGARTAALEANRLAPDLIPAAMVAAQALFRNGELRKGSKILETIWKKQPHPEIAETYVHARPGDSAADRLRRAESLARLKTHNAESLLAVGRAAYAANDFVKARQSVESALRMEPREGAYLLLADIEEAETGDQGRIRFWLSKAVRAPRDPAWTADGYVSDKWAPVSPVTGRLDAFEWRVPVEQIGPVVDAFDSEAPPALEMATIQQEVSEDAEVGGSEAGPDSDTKVSVELSADNDSKGQTKNSETGNPSGKVESQGSADEIEENANIIEAEEVDEPQEDNSEFPGHPPDDPGVSSEDRESAPRKFRLF